MRHRSDGNLYVYLWNNGATRATVHFCFTLVNEEHDKSISKGDRSLTDGRHSRPVLCEGSFEGFFPAVCRDGLGFSLCPAARVNDPSEGFLEKDFFLLRAEVRLKLQDNERWTVSIKRKTATCTVRSTSPSKHIDI